MYFLNVSISLYLQFLFLLVEALQCYSCKEENEELCEKKKVIKDCTNQTSCMTISYKLQQIESALYVTQKDCSNKLCVECSIMKKQIYIRNCQVCHSITLRKMSEYGLHISWSTFSCIQTEYEYLLCKSPYLVHITRIRTKKTPCLETFHAVNKRHLHCSVTVATL